MKIDNQITDSSILSEVGTRLARLRLEKNLTQIELARQAGVGVRTVQRLETGAVATQLSGLLRICRALGIVERFDALIPQSAASPIAELKRQGRKRQRASGSSPPPRDTGKWTWGEDT
ncbi:MAG: helix-turn-helix transcriptional regulator [Dokdonella sp.]